MDVETKSRTRGGPWLNSFLEFTAHLVFFPNLLISEANILDFAFHNRLSNARRSLLVKMFISLRKYQNYLEAV